MVDFAFGAGELNNINLLGDILSAFQIQYPEVTFDIFTNTTDIMQERMEKGLLDISLAVEPIDVENYDYIALPQKEIMGVYMRADSPLAAKEKIEVADLIGKPLLLLQRLLQSITTDMWTAGALFTPMVKIISKKLEYE